MPNVQWKNPDDGQRKFPKHVEFLDKKIRGISASVGFINTLRTGALKLLKCTFPGSKQFKSTFILCFFKNL